MDLFTIANQNLPSNSDRPLAEALRPKSIDDMVGQKKIVAKLSPFRRLLDQGQIPSLILWGPPGTGKTTFALLLSNQVEAEFITVNAVDVGAKALRELGEAARVRRLQLGRRTLLFIDEIHRLNKSQQDVLLPFVEKGELQLVGATTENPSYEINAALLSRCRILQFERLAADELQVLAERAFTKEKISLKETLSEEALRALVAIADGDGRRLLNLIEQVLTYVRGLASNAGDTTAFNAQAELPISAEKLSSLIEIQPVHYDKNADQHFDIISAFIKSVRGSDPSAAVYYLARMIKGGEDPVFIARRLVMLASEDVGNADPRALTVAVAGLQAVELIGLPEASITLAQVATYLASAPKSNRSYLALKEAEKLIEQTGSLPIPLSLRSAKTAAMKNLGYGKGYRYSHDSEKGYIAQDFLPIEISKTVLYEPTDHGFEKTIKQYLLWLKS